MIKRLLLIALLIPSLVYGGQLKDTIINNDLTIDTAGTIIMEGLTDDDNELTITLVNPSTDRTHTHPNATGTLALTSQADGTIDHGADLTGLDDEDHSSYIEKDGGTTTTAKIEFDVGIKVFATSGGNDTVEISDGSTLLKLRTDNLIPISFTVPGDPSSTFFITVSGVWNWGPGSSSTDTNLFRDSANVLRTSDAFISEILTTGSGAVGVDYTHTFDGQDNDGLYTWFEDEDQFQFSDDILMQSTESIFFRDTALFINSSTDGQLDIDADVELEIVAPTLDLNVATILTIDGATFDFNPTTEFQIDGALTDIGTGTYSLANGDNDLGVAGDLEVVGIAEFDGEVNGALVMLLGGGDNGTISADRYLEGFNGQIYTATLAVAMPVAGSITKIGCTTNVNAGAIGATYDLEVHVAGSNVFSCQIDTSAIGDTSCTADQARDTDTFTAGQILSLFANEGGVDSTTINDTQCWVWGIFDS